MESGDGWSAAAAHIDVVSDICCGVFGVSWSGSGVGWCAVAAHIDVVSDTWEGVISECWSGLGVDWYASAAHSEDVSGCSVAVWGVHGVPCLCVFGVSSFDVRVCVIVPLILN